MTTRERRRRGRKIEVAIVGGGCAGLSAAFELSAPELRDEYSVTVYQQGHRLGGKGASGRGQFHRIEEHGMHFWFGFYDNAFRMLRQAYEELGRDPLTCPMAEWTDALSPVPAVALLTETPAGWAPRVLRYPPMPGLPGDPVDADALFTMRGYLRRAADLVVTFVRAALEPGAPARPGRSRRREPRSTLEKSVSAILAGPALATVSAILAAAEALREVVELIADSVPLGDALSRAPLGLLDMVSAVAEREIERTAGGSDEVAWLWTAADLFLAAIRGILRFGLLTDPRGLDAVDDWDLRDFLRENGACRASLRSSFLRGGLYDLTFAYDLGRESAPSFAAGTALRAMLRMFLTYRGSFYWQMNGGMGDVVFAPLYEVLRARGVRFELFHRLRNVGVSDEGAAARGEKPWIESLTFDVQARTKGGRDYEPLVDVKGVPSWPSEPLWEQLDVGDARPDFESHWEPHRAGEKTLVAGEGFDLVVLAVGLGAVPHVARELVERSRRWRDMVRHVKTVATQSFQLWLDADARALGWPNDATAVTGYEKPFDSWADMSHVARLEGWQSPPRSVAYFVSALPDPEDEPDEDDAGYPARRRADVEGNARRALSHHIGGLWPRAVDERGAFRADLLHAEGRDAGAEGDARIATQYFRANLNPSDRYTLAVPGSSRYRISPLDLDFDNLTVAGDWTASGLGCGSIESAVMSGRLAAHALSGSPPLEDIVGFDHP
jgi:uncharacterized protein with NAD-binding domain and iron-sulfur cluster